MEPRRTDPTSRKRHKPEEVVAKLRQAAASCGKLRQADVLTSQGQSVADAVRGIGATEVTYHRWQREHGGLKSDQTKRMKELELGNQRLRKAVADLTLDKLVLAQAARGSFQAPHAGALVPSTSSSSGASPGVAPAAFLGQRRATQRKVPRGRDDEERLTADIIALAREYGRYGRRKTCALLQTAGWLVDAKRVERTWRREGLKVPARHPKKGRLWLADGFCVRLKPERRNHVRSCDLVENRTHGGRKVRMLNVVDEFAQPGAWPSGWPASSRPQT